MKTSILLLTTVLSAGIAFDMAPSARAAQADAHDTAHDVQGQVVHNTFGYCVRTAWTSEGDECHRTVQVAQVQKPVVHRQIAEEERTVYFEFNKIALVGSERHKLDSLADALKSMNDVSGVSIVGYADRIGSASYNEHLSEKRAEVVEAYLRARGYLNTTVAKTRWLGKSDPITQCADGMKRSALIPCLQQDRRVTVELKYQDEKSDAATTH